MICPVCGMELGDNKDSLWLCGECKLAVVRMDLFNLLNATITFTHNVLDVMSDTIAKAPKVELSDFFKDEEVN
jgi:hypothetical protein